MEAKRIKKNKKNVTPEKGNMASVNKTPVDASSRHLSLINYGERTGTSTLALGYPALTFYATIYFSMKRSTPRSAVLHRISSYQYITIYSISRLVGVGKEGRTSDWSMGLS